MRILLVEDNATFAEAFEKAVTKDGINEVIWAKSREAAFGHLVDDTSYDLVVLDRTIPTNDGVLDGSAAHGYAVFDKIRTEYQGTPVWFLTATEDADFAADLNNEHGRREDVHGSGADQQMYQVFWKRKLSDCVGAIKTYAGERRSLDGIAINCEKDLVLKRDEETVLRIFARQHQCNIMDVKSLYGGLTDSRVLKVVFKTPNNKAHLTAAAKLSTIARTENEASNYQAETVKLDPGGFPQLSGKVRAGAGRRGGLFYGMVGEEVENLFDRIAKGNAYAEAPAAIYAIERAWYEASEAALTTVGTIRRSLISDVSLQKVEHFLNGIPTADIDKIAIKVNQCRQHCDLHCGNIVYDRHGKPMLIDFGDIKQAASALDPITLELSAVFHPERSKLPKGWPSEEHLQNWLDLDSYTKGCSFSEFVRECRKWANIVAVDQTELVAIAYSYALRQLKYEKSDKTLVLSLIRACRKYFNL